MCVVSHAGVGSILLARRHGKRALVVPRRLHLREAVDDHQLTLARRLAGNGIVELVEDEQRLAATLARSAHGTVSESVPDSDLAGAAELADDIRSYLRDLVPA